MRRYRVKCVRMRVRTRVSGGNTRRKKNGKKGVWKKRNIREVGVWKEIMEGSASRCE